MLCLPVKVLHASELHGLAAAHFLVAWLGQVIARASLGSSWMSTVSSDVCGSGQHSWNHILIRGHALRLTTLEMRRNAFDKPDSCRWNRSVLAQLPDLSRMHLPDHALPFLFRWHNC